MKKSFTLGILIFVSSITFIGFGVYYYMYSKLVSNTKQGISLESEVAQESGEEDATRALRTAITSTSKEHTYSCCPRGTDQRAATNRIQQREEGRTALRRETQ